MISTSEILAFEWLFVCCPFGFYTCAWILPKMSPSTTWAEFFQMHVTPYPFGATSWRDLFGFPELERVEKQYASNLPYR